MEIINNCLILILDIMKTKNGFAGFKYWMLSCLFVGGISSDVWAVDFVDGTGTVEDPYVISTADELNAVRNNLNAHYQLGADIDLADWINVNSPDAGWLPIGTSDTPFIGSFNGNGHAIENIWVETSEANAGLFGVVGVDVTIQRLGVVVADGKKISGGSNVGILVGLSTGVGGTKQTLIQEVYVSGNVESKGTLVGGIVGRNNNQNITILNSYAKGNVYATGDGVGGIIGSSYGACATLVDRCYALNNITVDGGGSTGGIMGTVSAPDASVEQMNATISNCVAINKRLTVRDDIPNRIFTWAKQDKVVLQDNMAFSGCLINEAPFSSSDANGKNGQDKDADELASQSTYANWDFENVWVMGNGAFQLPVLKNVSLEKQPEDAYSLDLDSDNPFVDLVPEGGELNVVEQCGVANNGRDDVTELIQQAIDACSMKKATVVVPSGRYAIRPIFLRSNVTLNLEEGAQLIGSRNIEDYRAAFPNAGAIETSALVFGKGIENVKIIGKGIINGRGDAPDFDFGNGNGDRPKVLHLVDCKNVVVEDVTLQNSAFWTAHFLLCDGVKIKGVKIYSHTNWNNDGIDIDSKNVEIEDCDIDCDDDGICMKSDRGVMVENVTVKNCTIRTNCNAIKLGTAGKTGFRNITYTDCVIEKASEDNFRKHYENSKLAFCGINMEGPSVISGISLESVNGGILDDVNISNIQMKDVHTAIFLRLGQREGSPQMSELKNVTISNVKATCVSKLASSIVGVPGGIIDNVLIKDVEITLPGGGTVNDANANVPELVDAYPEANMFGTPFPAYGFYVRHADNVKFDNVKFNLLAADARPEYVFDDVENHEVITGIELVVDEDDLEFAFDTDGRLQVSSHIDGFAQIEVFDISGKMVGAASMQASETASIVLPGTGIYIVTIQTSGRTIARKVACM